MIKDWPQYKKLRQIASNKDYEASVSFYNKTLRFIVNNINLHNSHNCQLISDMNSYDDLKTYLEQVLTMLDSNK